MERTTSVLRNKTKKPRRQLSVTKYEPRSCSKTVMAAEAISWDLVLSNLGFCDGLKGKELMVTKPYEHHKSKWVFV